MDDAALLGARLLAALILLLHRGPDSRRRAARHPDNLQRHHPDLRQKSAAARRAGHVRDLDFRRADFPRAQPDRDASQESCAGDGGIRALDQAPVAARRVLPQIPDRRPVAPDAGRRPAVPPAFLHRRQRHLQRHLLLLEPARHVLLQPEDGNPLGLHLGCLFRALDDLLLAQGRFPAGKSRRLGPCFGTTPPALSRSEQIPAAGRRGTRLLPLDPALRRRMEMEPQIPLAGHLDRPHHVGPAHRAEFLHLLLCDVADGRFPDLRAASGAASSAFGASSRRWSVSCRSWRKRARSPRASCRRAS